MSSITVQEHVLLHLSQYSNRRPNVYNMPFAVTQDGIAEALGISRAHVSLELKKLKDNGRVSSILAHTPRAKRKRRTYYLQPRGRSAVPKINERMVIAKIGIAETAEA